MGSFFYGSGSSLVSSLYGSGSSLVSSHKLTNCASVTCFVSLASLAYALLAR